MGGSFLLFWTPSSPRLSVLLSGLPRLALNEGRTVYIFPLLRGGEAGVDCSELENIICDIWIDFPFREKYDF